MNLELVAENDFGVSQYERVNQIIHYKFRGVANIEKAKEIFHKTLDFSEKNKVSGIQSDIVELIGSFTKLEAYFSEDYFPILQKRGLKCNSIIVSKDIFSKYSAQRLVENSAKHKNTGFKMETFSNIVEGYQWLLKTIK
jgi:hypothetical protein